MLHQQLLEGPDLLGELTGRLGTQDESSCVPADTAPKAVALRDARGRLLPGSQLAVKHGLNSLDASLLAAFRSEGRALLDQSIADDGEEPPARRRSLHEYRASLHVTILALSAALESRGMFDGKGKLREKWIARLESLINTAKGLDGVLGLERREKRTKSLHELAAEAIERRETGDCQ